jgi:FKBP-type peptidyl-prolyl cis-trans isomerase
MRMRQRWVILLGILLLASMANAQESTILKDRKDRISYSIGADIGKGLKNLPVGVNLDLVFKGIKDMLSETRPLMTEQEVRETMTVFQKEMAAWQQNRLKATAEKNKKEGEVYLSENQKREGVVTLPSGLQYKVLKPGEGKTPTETDTVTVNYRGMLINGTEFDSSYRRGQPAAFPVKGVIAWWTEALKLMQEGAKWQLFIPPSLAYGERGSGSQIGPNATLIFEVELVSVGEKKQD